MYQVSRIVFLCFIVNGKGFDSAVNFDYYQPDRALPRELKAMPHELQQSIQALLKKRNAVLLAHNYMRDEVQEIADITGDSLGLSQEAAKTAADVIVFCGVHFMAESAAILAPRKDRPAAAHGCRLSDGRHDYG